MQKIRHRKFEGEYVRSSTLAEQFSRPETYQYGSTEIDVFDVQPEPEKIKTDVPAFFGTGWSASKGVYESFILGMADKGRRVISTYAPHGIDTEPDFGKGEKTYAAAELRKAAAMLKTLEEKGVEQIDIVAHSEAAIWTLIVATMHPEKIRNIVLINPAGLIGEDSLPRLAVDFSLDMVQSALNFEKFPRPKIERSVQPGSPADLFGALRNIAGQPLQSLKEVLAIKNADIRQILEDLKAQGKCISVIQSEHDPVFPLKRMGEIVNEEHVDGLYSIPGNHNELNVNPQPYADSADHALDALERLSRMRKIPKRNEVQD